MVFVKIVHDHSQSTGVRCPANILDVHDVRRSQGSWDSEDLTESGGTQTAQVGVNNITISATLQFVVHLFNQMNMYI